MDVTQSQNDSQLEEPARVVEIVDIVRVKLNIPTREVSVLNISSYPCGRYEGRIDKPSPGQTAYGLWDVATCISPFPNIIYEGL